MRLILVRHTSVAVDRGVCYGHSDVLPTETFEREADEVKKKLAKMHIDMAYTSPLARCKMLADYCGFPDAVQDSRLMEMNFGDWEMMRYDEITDPRLQLWYDDYLNVAPTNGESSLNQRERFKDFLSSLNSSEDKTIVIFTHGGVMIHALVLLKGLSYEEAFSCALSYGAILDFDLPCEF